MFVWLPQGVVCVCVCMAHRGRLTRAGTAPSDAVSDIFRVCYVYVLCTSGGDVAGFQRLAYVAVAVVICTLL